MDNIEIRLRILFGCYAEMYHGQPKGGWMKSLGGAGVRAVEANMAYLVDTGLVAGVVDRYINGRLLVRIGRILPGGVDIVEDITRMSMERLDGPVSEEIRGSPDAQRAFWEKCVNVTKVCAVAVDVTEKILSGLG